MPKGIPVKLNDEQKQFIQKNHLLLRYGEMSRILGINEASIIKYTNELCKKGILPPKPFSKNWTKNEEEKLVNLINSKDVSNDELEICFDHSMSSILYKISSLRKKGLIRSDFIIHSCDIYKKYRNTEISNWNDSEVDLLKNNVQYKTLLELCDMLKKGTLDVLCQIRKLLPCTICSNAYHTIFDFSEREDFYLIERINLDSKEQIMNQIPHKTWKQIRKRVKLFGINRKKSSKDISNIELLMKNFLKKFEISYEYQKEIIYGNYSYWVDFYLGKNIIIETMGDYWHGNDIVYEKLNDIQKSKKEHDIKRNKILSDLGYRIFYFWEYDLKNNIYDCENKLQFIKTLIGDKHD